MGVSMPYALIQEVENKLSYKQSRSKWVQGAIRAKLDQSEAFDLSNIASIRLAWELHMRQIISRGMFDSIEAVIKATSQSVETEE